METFYLDPIYTTAIDHQTTHHSGIDTLQSHCVWVTVTMVIANYSTTESRALKVSTKLPLD